MRDFASLFDSVRMMPYVSVNYNLQSGKAFSTSASGVGYGAGLAFDMSSEGRKLGLYFDFAWQDMRAFAKNGSCLNLPGNDSVLEVVDAEHYFQYVLFETFLKIQTEKSNGYLLIGPSFGLATYSTTRSVKYAEDGKTPIRDSYALWEGTSYGHSFRLDMRAALGLKIANFGARQLFFEARFGYPITSAISDYANVCAGSGEPGSWRVVSVQGNLGLKF